MNKAVALLTASTVVLTASTLYYAHELGELRSREPPAAHPAVGDAPPPIAVPAANELPATAAGPGTSPASPASGASPAAAPFDMPGSLASDRALHSESARRFLAQYDDAEKRERMIAAAIDSRRKRLRKTANELDIPEDQLDTLIELQIEARMDRQVRLGRCLLDPACAKPEPPPASFEERGQAITEKIGEQKLAQLRAQDRRNGPEGPMLEKLQNRLPPELRLKPAEMDALADAVGEEVRQMQNELRTGGRKVTTFSGYSVIPYVRGIPTMEENLGMAYRSSRRLNDVAATQLSGERLETFQTLQADGVVKFREYIRRQIQLRAAGYEAH
jgi:hypothetical protein